VIQSYSYCLTWTRSGKVELFPIVCWHVVQSQGKVSPIIGAVYLHHNTAIFISRTDLLPRNMFDGSNKTHLHYLFARFKLHCVREYCKMFKQNPRTSCIGSIQMIYSAWPVAGCWIFSTSNRRKWSVDLPLIIHISVSLHHSWAICTN